MSAIVHQITVCSGTDQRKSQSSVSLAFVRGIHRWPVDSPHKGPVTQKMCPLDDITIVMRSLQGCYAGIMELYKYSPVPASAKWYTEWMGEFSPNFAETWSPEIYVVQLFWHLTGVSAAVLPRGLANFRTIPLFLHSISRLCNHCKWPWFCFLESLYNMIATIWQFNHVRDRATHLWMQHLCQCMIIILTIPTKTGFLLS